MQVMQRHGPKASLQSLQSLNQVRIPIQTAPRPHSALRKAAQPSDRVRCRNSAAPERQPDAHRDAFSERLTPENLVELLRSKRNGEIWLCTWSGLPRAPHQRI